MELASLNRRKFTVCRDAPDTSVPGFTVSPVVKKEFILPLILYFMEKETNFAFDAIWIDNKIVEKDDECELNDDIPEEVFHNYAKHPMPKASPAADAKQAQFVTWSMFFSIFVNINTFCFPDMSVSFSKHLFLLLYTISLLARCFKEEKTLEILV